jgi:hypothetical protein
MQLALGLRSFVTHGKFLIENSETANPETVKVFQGLLFHVFFERETTPKESCFLGSGYS